PNSIAVGSRHGSTRVDGVNVRLQAGQAGTDSRFVLVGFRTEGQGATYTVTGPISITAVLDVTAQGGGDSLNFVQVGHGGENSSGNFWGEVAIVAGQHISFTSGGAFNAYAQAGNGGFNVTGNMTGNHTLSATGSIVFTAGAGQNSYVQAGNGGF